MGSMINGKIWTSSADATREMGTDDGQIIGEIHWLTELLHHEVDWSGTLTEEDDARGQHWQSCLSLVRHFYNDADIWHAGKYGGWLVKLSKEARRCALAEYAGEIGHPIRKHIEHL